MKDTEKYIRGLDESNDNVFDNIIDVCESIIINFTDRSGNVSSPTYDDGEYVIDPNIVSRLHTIVSSQRSNKR